MNIEQLDLEINRLQKIRDSLFKENVNKFLESQEYQDLKNEYFEIGNQIKSWTCNATTKFRSCLSDYWVGHTYLIADNESSEARSIFDQEIGPIKEQYIDKLKSFSKKSGMGMYDLHLSFKGEKLSCLTDYYEEN